MSSFYRGEQKSFRLRYMVDPFCCLKRKCFGFVQLYALAPYALSHLVISLSQTRWVKCIGVLYKRNISCYCTPQL